MAQYYYAQSGQQQGPVSLEQLQQMADSGRLQSGDLVWTEGMANWMPAGSVAALSGRFGGSVAVAAAPRPGRPAVLGYQTPDAYYPVDLKPVSFGMFCGLLGGGLVGMFLAGVAVGLSGDEGPSGLAIVLMIAAVGTMIAGGIYGLIILYRGWMLVPPQYARTTPGKAVGFLFIPLFNLYWNFQAYGGLPKDYNAHVKPRDPHAPDVSESIGTMVAVMILLSNIPLIGGLFGIIAVVLIFIFMKQVANAINHTCQRRAG